MTIDEYSMSTQAQNAIKEAGYQIYSGMDEHISLWWRWYTASYDEFYKVPYIAKNSKGEDIQRQRPRMTLKPAKRVCREFASLILAEDTEISAEGPQANEWLREYLDANNFWPNGQNLIEKAFSIGTAGWFLWFDIREKNADSVIKLRRYDARMIKPLSFDEEGITECAVGSRITAKGKPIEQLVMYVLEEGTYHVKTKLFRDSHELVPEDYGFLSDFDTQSDRKPFGIVKPALENTLADLSPYGISAFHDALDAVRAVDLAFDSMCQEIELTGVKIFMAEELINLRSVDGKTVPLTDQDQRKFRITEGQAANKLIDIFSPQIRIDPLRQGLDVALAELGDECGFGQEYFTLDKAGGLKTATEVVSDNSALMRNVRKHENVVRGAIQDVLSALLDNARIHCGAPIEEDFGVVSVKFDDSVITDTQTAKQQMLAEISAGVLPKWKYAVTFYGLTEEEAKAQLPQETVFDPGF